MTVAETIIFWVVFVNPMNKLVRISVSNVSDDQFRQTIHMNATP